MLEGLMKELEAIDLNDPEVTKLVDGFELDDPEDGDEFIGTLDEHIIKLKVLCAKMYQEAMKMVKDHEAAHLDPRQNHDKEACKAFHQSFVEHMARMELLQDMTWMLIRLDHDLITAESVGVRKGWQVVKSKPKPRTMGGAMIGVLSLGNSDGMAELLSMMGGSHKHGHSGGCSGCSH